MTTAESNNERATLDELGEALDQAATDACNAGIPAESVARMMVTTGILGALEAGVPRHGIHDIHRWLEHCCRRALESIAGDIRVVASEAVAPGEAVIVGSDGKGIRFRLTGAIASAEQEGA